jgi:hypothetical protein
VFLEGWVGVLCSCRFRFSWVCLVGFFLSLFGLFFFSFSSFAFSLVYCRCTKGRLTLLIKSVYYLSKKLVPLVSSFISLVCVYIYTLKMSYINLSMYISN